MTDATRRLAERVAPDVRWSCRCGSTGTDWPGFLYHSTAHIDPDEDVE